MLDGYFRLVIYTAADICTCVGSCDLLVVSGVVSLEDREIAKPFFDPTVVMKFVIYSMDEDWHLYQMFRTSVQQYQSGSSDALIMQAKVLEEIGQAGGGQELAQEDDMSLQSGLVGGQGNQKLVQEDDDVSLQSDEGICTFLTNNVVVHVLEQEESTRDTSTSVNEGQQSVECGQFLDES